MLLHFHKDIFSNAAGEHKCKLAQDCSTAGVLCYPVLRVYCAKLPCTAGVLRCTVVYCGKLRHTAVNCDELYCTVLYCTAGVNKALRF